jgi:hypothetical protein
MEKGIVLLDNALLSHMEVLNYCLQNPGHEKALIDQEKAIIEALRNVRVSMIRILEKEYKK